MKRLWTLALLATLGCGGGRAPVASQEEAKGALETSLNAWRDGKPPGLVAETPKMIQATDFEWQAGQTIASYTIASDEPGEGGRVFTVKLTMKTPPGDKDARYVVFGAGPIFVSRYEDYQRTVNMEDDPATKARRPR